MPVKSTNPASKKSRTYSIIVMNPYGGEHVMKNAATYSKTQQIFSSVAKRWEDKGYTVERGATFVKATQGKTVRKVYSVENKR